MDTSALIQELGQALSTLATKVKQAAAKVRPTAFLADNTDKVGGATVATLRTQMGATLATHTSAANPHGDTAAKVGIPLKATVDAAMAALIPSGILPVSSFGSKDYLPPNVSGGWIVYFTDETPLFMAGSLYSLIPTSIDLTTVSPNPANKTFYVYVQLVQGVPRYVIRETEAADSETSMYIGRITTTGSGIGQIDINKVDRIGTFRLSATPIGSAIPISSGHPADASTIAW
jgi:hypothetical protein